MSTAPMLSASAVHSPDAPSRSRLSTSHPIQFSPSGSTPSAPQQRTINSTESSPKSASNQRLAAALKMLRVHSSSSSSSTSSSSRSSSSSASTTIEDEPSVLPEQINSPPRRYDDVVPAALTPPGSSFREVSISSPPNVVDIKQQQVGYDHALVSLWAKISDLTSDMVSQLQYTLPSEHLRSLALHRDAVSDALPKVAASLHDPTVTPSPIKRGGASTSKGEVVRTPAVDALGHVDAFHSEVELLMKHHLCAIESRLERRQLQLQEVKQTNALLSSQKERLERLLKDHHEEGVANQESYDVSVAAVRETLRDLADRIDLHRQREAAVDATFISKDNADKCAADGKQPEALDELSDRGLLLNSAVFYLTTWTQSQQHHARVYDGYQTFLTETEPEEARARRWKNRLASSSHPEAFAEYVDDYQRSVNEARQQYLNDITPVETYVNTIADTQNDNKYRKMTRSRSPARDRSTRARSVSPRLPDLRLAELSATRRPLDEPRADDELSRSVVSPTCVSAPKSPRRFNDSLAKDTPRVVLPHNASHKDPQRAASPYVPAFYAHQQQAPRPVSPSYSQVSGAAPKSPRRPCPLSNDDLALLPDTARTDVSVGRSTTCRSVAGGRSPSRREAAFRHNGMVHVATSEQAVDHFLIPRQSNPAVPRTNGGTDLPSLQTLLLRRKKLQAELLRLQLLAKREMVVQMRMLDGAQRTAEQRLAKARRRRDAPVLSDV